MVKESLELSGFHLGKGVQIDIEFDFFLPIILVNFMNPRLEQDFF